MARKRHSRSPAKCCLLSPTKYFAAGAYFAPAPWQGGVVSIPQVFQPVADHATGNGTSSGLPARRCVRTHGCSGLAEGKALGRDRCCSSTPVLAGLNRAQRGVPGRRVSSACSHLPPLCPPLLQSPLSLPETAKSPAAEGTGFPGAHGLEDRER